MDTAIYWWVRVKAFSSMIRLEFLVTSVYENACIVIKQIFFFCGGQSRVTISLKHCLNTKHSQIRRTWWPQLSSGMFTALIVNSSHTGGKVKNLIEYKAEYFNGFLWLSVWLSIQNVKKQLWHWTKMCGGIKATWLIYK